MDKRLGYHADIRHHTTPEHDEMCMFVHDNYNLIAELILKKLGLFDKIDYFSVENPKLEHPVKFQKNNYNNKVVVGYIDVSTKILLEDVGTEEQFERHDLWDEFEYNEDNQSAFKPINFEIKPKVDSLGDTIRQIEFYKFHDEAPEVAQWVLVTKTKNLGRYFEKQGIMAYDYDELKKEVFNLKEEKRKEEEKKKLEEEDRLAYERKRAKERKERMDRFKAKASGFVRGIFGMKEKNSEKSYECIQCGRAINHKGRCWPCNTKNKRNKSSN